MAQGWGNPFNMAWSAATEYAREFACRVIDAGAGAAEAISDTVVDAATATWSGLKTTGSAVATGAGELLNTVAGVAVFTSALIARKSKELFLKVAAWFGAGGSPAAPNLITRCPGANNTDITTRAYRKTLVGSRFTGADGPELNKAMHALSSARTPEQTQSALEDIARIRERPLEDIQAEHARYLELKQAADDRVAGGAEAIDQLKDSQADFMGSTEQLHYGQVVGDQLGLDPTFGALLNPTGGLVGPGKSGFDPRSAAMPEAVAYHGAYHDAMGYLWNYHGEGPGYNYMGSPIGLDTSSPLAGQATGIAEWEVLLLRGGP